MILSILIPTIKSRYAMFADLTFNLQDQICRGYPDIEIMFDMGDGSVGVKRQRLIQQAKGDYVVFIDDDDKIAHNYISEIHQALQMQPDAVGFYGWISTNGKHQKQFKISKDCDYITTPAGHERFNNHLSPVKREHALAIGYKDMTYQEDYDYACRLKESGLIQTEVFINKHLYHYLYVTKK